MKLIVSVNCAEGEESIWISEISEEELNLLSELFTRIQSYQGYFPTGDYLRQAIEEQGLTPDTLYSDLAGYKIINKFLPTPSHGFSKIREVTIISEYRTYSLI